jgi:putative membrane protein
VRPMVRILLGLLVSLLANAIGLVVAASLLDNMELTATGFVIAVVLFTVVYAIAQPFLTQMAMTKVPALRGGVALIATLVALIITALVTDGLSISGASTWVLASLIVWVVSLIGALLLPMLLIKDAVEERRD